MWTKQLGDQYREQYSMYTFKEKQQQMNLVLEKHFQIVDRPRFLFDCLSQIRPLPLHVVELGGYDGTQALDILESHPTLSWVNYDISKVAANLTRPVLVNYNYACVVLDKPFTEYDLGNFDVFYSSKTLEHLHLEEVLQTLTTTQKAKHQIHIIDWFWKNDTHVIESGKHRTIIRHLKGLGYKMRNVFRHKYQSRIFCSRDEPC